MLGRRASDGTRPRGRPSLLAEPWIGERFDAVPATQTDGTADQVGCSVVGRSAPGVPRSRMTAPAACGPWPKPTRDSRARSGSLSPNQMRRCRTYPTLVASGLNGPGLAPVEPLDRARTQPGGVTAGAPAAMRQRPEQYCRVLRLAVRGALQRCQRQGWCNANAITAGARTRATRRHRSMAQPDAPSPAPRQRADPVERSRPSATNWARSGLGLHDGFRGYQGTELSSQSRSPLPPGPVPAWAALSSAPGSCAGLLKHGARFGPGVELGPRL